MAPLEAQRAWEAQAQLQKLEAQVRQQQEQVAQVPGMTMVVVKVISDSNKTNSKNM